MSFTHAESYPLRSIDLLLSLVAVKRGHTISAVGVEPCTGRLYFSGGGVVTRRRNTDGGGGWSPGGETTVGGERVTRAYTVEVQTTSVFYAQSLILLAS